MVATGARARALAELLTDRAVYAQYNEPWGQVAPPAVPRLAHLSAVRRYAVRNAYDRLGGRHDQFEKVRPGGWDLAFETPQGTVLIELDEEQHFTRYRGVTIRESLRINGEPPWSAPYLTFCESDEVPLVPSYTWGKFWTSPSSERFFGAASPPGDFTGVGSPRWRQRAFYDAFKDVLAAPASGEPDGTEPGPGGVRLSRVSVHDTVGRRTGRPPSVPCSDRSPPSAPGKRAACVTWSAAESTRE
jgi:hypothetical protein